MLDHSIPTWSPVELPQNKVHHEISWILCHIFQMNMAVGLPSMCFPWSFPQFPAVSAKLWPTHRSAPSIISLCAKTWTSGGYTKASPAGSAAGFSWEKPLEIEVINAIYLWSSDISTYFKPENPEMETTMLGNMEVICWNGCHRCPATSFIL